MKSKTNGSVRPIEPLEPEQYLNADEVNSYFHRHGLKVPHRNTILNMEKRKEFPRRFHAGNQFGPSHWKKSEVESYFRHFADSQPKGWKPPEERRRQ